MDVRAVIMVTLQKASQEIILKPLLIAVAVTQQKRLVNKGFVVNQLHGAYVK